ncbi:hypothetical protein ScPMuIL_005772 [Solemya velum]
MLVLSFYKVDDLQSVLKRALDVGLKKIFITGGYLEDAIRKLWKWRTQKITYTVLELWLRQVMEVIPEAHGEDIEE